MGWMRGRRMEKRGVSTPLRPDGNSAAKGTRSEQAGYQIRPDLMSSDFFAAFLGLF